jgi:alpha-amylase/alpha-mannosidase (GH57 family)
MGKSKLGLAILWHQHQPYYKSSSGVYQMPWVRFHSTKDYLDLLLVLQEFPKIKQNFNLVPSLLAQIQDYAENGATDLVWDLTEKPADKLNPEEKKKILKNFFIININNMVKPYPRYYELYLKLKNFIKDESIDQHYQAFSNEDYRDLQIWYNLSWVGVESRRKPELARLYKKDRMFTEADKKTLLKEIRLLMGKIIPTFKKMWENEQLELSTSPFYHPILPLLCNTGVGRESAPSIPLPQQPFVYPEDAEIQIEKGLAYFDKLFGRKPLGMWPSEGSVSMETLEIIARQGLQWAATDEGILANSLREEFSQTRIYQPYLLHTGKNDIHLFFRDHYLSDAIGFVYSNWPYEQAVSDLLGRLHAIRKLLIDQQGEDSLSRFVVPIILDGENCWEYYADDGKPFLRHLYQTITNDELVESLTFSQVLRRNKKPEKLTTIHPGSWINSNFNIWIGSEEDNRSWDILLQTRQFLVNQQNEGIHAEEVIQQAWEKIYIAEGSDWNWWYGEEHSSANDMEFDSLYREHLMEIYQLLNHEIPPILYQTIKRRHYDHFQSYKPKNFITPVLDGRSSHFYEWVGAAVYDIAKTPQSSMHQVTRILDKLYVGFNAKTLFVRLDFLSKPDPLVEFVLAVKRPRPVTIVLSPLRGVIEKFELEDEIHKRDSLRPAFKIDRLLELGISFKDLKLKPADILGFQLLVKLNGKPLEEFPRMNLIELEVPSQEFDLIEWSV